MKLFKTFILSTSITLATSSVALADQAILIGGGYNINGSQGQIEKNVKWVQEVLTKSNMPVSTFFNDGDDEAADVHYIHQNSESAESTPFDELAVALEPVARLFGDQLNNTIRFRNHTVPNVQGSTSAKELTQSLVDIFLETADEPHLIVYNGHGKQSPNSIDKVTMELWGNTKLTASELHSVVEKSNKPTRFVFTQCYSGGFHRLAYKNPESGLELSDSLRCGFTAESAYRLAEGCSASVNSDDYRDYTTYFFAALDGYDRNGEILSVNTDSNNDGDVSMREAHFYTLATAHSTDLSRSTSEDYLQNWQPWYLKWVAGRFDLPNNEYSKIFRALADRYDLPLNNSTAKELRNRIKMYEKAANSLQNKRAVIYDELTEIQHKLIKQASNKWPALSGPYTAGFQSMTMSGEMINVASWVSEQPAYPRIVELQNEDNTLVDAQVDNERNLTQMQKMLHLRKLALLKQQLYQFGTNKEVKGYEKLVGCEDSPLILSNK